jgi:hypothetical protein
MEQSKEVNRTAEDILNLKRLNISISMRNYILEAMEEHASLQRAEMKRELDDLQLRQKRIDAANDVYRNEAKQLQEEVERLKSVLVITNDTLLSGIPLETADPVHKMIIKALTSGK